MSNTSQQPNHPTTLPQLAGIFGSLTQATNEVLGGNPEFVAEVRNLYTSFLASPTTIKILGYNPTIHPAKITPSDSLHKETHAIKDAVTTLSKAVQCSLLEELPTTNQRAPFAHPATTTD
jgi:hypothetical protein